MQNSPEQPLVSIGCVTYNHERYIRDALDGFLMQQTDFPFEVIVHDDASKDRTAAIVREYAEKYPHIIKPILQTENQYSRGIKPFPAHILPKMQGRFIALCEGDDYWSDLRKLQKQVDLLKAHPEYTACFHSVKSFVENAPDKQHIIAPRPKRPFYTQQDVVSHVKVRTSSVFVRREAAQLPEWFKTTMVADYAFAALIAEHGNIGYIDEPMSVYRRHDDSWTTSHRLTRLQQSLDARERVNKHLNYKYDSLIDMSSLLRDIVHYHIEVGDSANARRVLVHCIRRARIDHQVSFRALRRLTLSVIQLQFSRKDSIKSFDDDLVERTP